jgi:mannosyltransferase
MRAGWRCRRRELRRQRCPDSLTESTRRRTAVVGLSAVALLIRALVASGSGLWRDEALFMFITRSESWSGMIDFLQRHESHPPLFYALMRVWLSMAGDSDAAALALPVVLGAALVPVVYLVGASVFSTRVALLAALLTALSPALTQFSAQVRPYSLLPLLALLSSFTLIRGVERGDRRAWAGYVLSTLALLYTHNWGWLVLGAQWAAVAVVIARANVRAPGTIVREWILIQVIVAVGYLPWFPSLLYQVRHAGHPGLALTGWSDVLIFLTLAARALLQSTVMAYPAADGSSVAARWFVALPLVIVAIGVVLGWRAPARTERAPNGGASDQMNMRAGVIILAIVPLVAWLLALALSSRSNMVLPRCLVMLAPSLLLVIAYWLGSRGSKLFLLSGLVVVVLLVTYAATDLALTRTTRSNAREVATAVAARTRPSDLVIIAPEWLASSFNRYYAPMVEQIDFPHFGREGAVDLAGLRERTLDRRALTRIRRRIAEARTEGRRVWLIIDASYVRDLRSEDSTRAEESLDFGEAGTLRANQIRAELRSLYGEPDTTISRAGRTTQYEDFRPFLFAPPDE